MSRRGYLLGSDCVGRSPWIARDASSRCLDRRKTPPTAPWLSQAHSQLRRIGFVLSALAAVLIAHAQGIKMTALEDFEHRFEARLAQIPPPYPFEILFPAPAIYVPGVGVMLSSIVNLSYLDQPSPFRPPFTPKELAAFRERKLQRVPILEQSMREVLAETAASSDIDPVPPNERIILGVTLFYFKWEDSTGLPRQIVMSAEKQKLLEARRAKVDLASVIQEQKL